MEPAPATPPRTPNRAKRLLGPAILLALTLVVYGDVLFHPADRVIGSPSGDVAMHSLWWHDLGLRELARGHLTLWNPYVYGGSPFHAGFAAALLYPPLWIGMVLPVHVTLNWLFASHVFLAGLFTYLCCRTRRPVARRQRAGRRGVHVQRRVLPAHVSGPPHRHRRDDVAAGDRARIRSSRRHRPLAVGRVRRGRCGDADLRRAGAVLLLHRHCRRNLRTAACGNGA
jgi:hypothetical protein